MLDRQSARLLSSGFPYPSEVILNEVNILERQLWRRPLLRAARNPRSYIYQLVPSYGLRGAVQTFLGQLWVEAMMVGFLNLPLQFAPRSIARWAEWVPIWLAAACGSFALFHSAVALVNRHRWRRP